MTNQLLAPAAVLVLWTLIVFYWMILTRFPALKAAGIDIGKMTGGKGTDADGVLPAKTQWKAHNYNHLMEQPTIFYATIGILAIAGHANELNIALAWGYVIFRIAHSLWQALINKVSIRFLLFCLASFCLTVLAINAVRATLGV